MANKFDATAKVIPLSGRDAVGDERPKGKGRIIAVILSDDAIEVVRQGDPQRNTKDGLKWGREYVEYLTTLFAAKKPTNTVLWTARKHGAKAAPQVSLATVYPEAISLAKPKDGSTGASQSSGPLTSK